MKIIHKKIKKELEISGYLRLKEDMCMLKSILFVKDDWKIFHPILDFRDVCRVVKNNPVKSDCFEDYLIQSYASEKITKNVNIAQLNEQMRKVKDKFYKFDSKVKFNNLVGGSSSNQNTYLNNLNKQERLKSPKSEVFIQLETNNL
jgi:hypothetical protein